MMNASEFFYVLPRFVRDYFLCSTFPTWDLHFFILLVIICAKMHPTNMAWCLLYVTTFRAHLWVSWCFSLLFKAVKIIGPAARAHMAQVWLSAHHGRPAYPPGSCYHSLPEMHSMLDWVHAILMMLGTVSCSVSSASPSRSSPVVPCTLAVTLHCYLSRTEIS